MNKKIKKEIDNLVNQLVSHYKPEKIILFGSAKKKGRQRPNDIDLLVIKKTNQRRLRRRAEAMKNISCDIPVDLIILTPEEVEILKSKNTSFIKQIIEKGIYLYG